MGEVGYAISERDYRILQDMLRKIDRMSHFNLARRFPVLGGGGGGLGYPKPGGLTITSHPTTLVKATHEGKWLFFDNFTGGAIGEDSIVTMPSSMAVGDRYYLVCHREYSNYKIYLYPNLGQSIIMPSETISMPSVQIPGVNYDYVRMGAYHAATTQYSPELWFLILVCCAANTWIAQRASSSIIGP